MTEKNAFRDVVLAHVKKAPKAVVNHDANTWYGLKHGADPALFESWVELEDTSKDRLVNMPARYCGECHDRIAIGDYMTYKQLTFLDAFFVFTHGQFMVCQKCWSKINEYK